MSLLMLALLLLLSLASITLAAVEAAFYLVKRRRFGHLGLTNALVDLANRYLEDPPTLLMPVHMGTYTAHVGMTVVLTWLLLPALEQWAMVASFTAMLVYLLLFRLTVPYALVGREPEKSLLLLLPGFHLYARALRPLVVFLRKKAAPESVADPADDTPTIVPEVPPAPVHDPDEERLVASVARFATTQVKDVMTPRPDIVAMPVSGTVGELRRIMRETKYSRIPVFGENLDDIVGALTVRDLVEYEGDAGDPLLPLSRPVFVVPESKKATELLKELQARRTSFAIVIDEYGGTAGLVTVEDIVEEIVGEIKDEYDVESEPIQVEDDGSVLVAGRVSVDRLEQALETRLADGDDVGTVGGLVTTVFGRIPKAGETVDYRGFVLEVMDAERKRVNRVRFRRRPVENGA